MVVTKLQKTNFLTEDKRIEAKKLAHQLNIL